MIAGSAKHRFILPVAVLLAILCIVGGQTILERIFSFNTALSVIIEFLGGLVFIILLVRGTRVDRNQPGQQILQRHTCRR